LSLFCRGSQAPLEALRCRFAPDSPDSGIPGVMVIRPTVLFHASGGLTAADRAPMQFLPLTLPCIVAWIIDSATAPGVLATRDVASFMDREERG
jgi:hypothetical protein